MPRGFNFWFTSQLVYYISWNYTSHSFLNQDVINDYVSGTGTNVMFCLVVKAGTLSWAILDSDHNQDSVPVKKNVWIGS